MNYYSKVLWLLTLAAINLNADASATSPNHFYVRFDMGAAWLKNQNINSTIGSPPLPTGAEPQLSESKLSAKNALVGQLGFGYIFSPYIRMDLTGTQTGNFDLTSTCIPSLVCPEGLVATGDIHSGQLMVNGYVDFGQWFGVNNWFNPYLGGGIGAAHNKVGKLSSELGGVEVSSLNSASSNSFAWRLIGGIGFIFSRHVGLDFSYTYTDAGTVDGGSIVTLNNGSSFELAKPASIDVNLQELMLGLRFRF